MESQNYDSEYTVQGGDPPVPVGEGGARIGPPRPSSHDCPAPSVMHQAGVQEIATDRQVAPLVGGAEGFKRSKMIARSPVRPARSISISSSCGSEKKDEDLLTGDDSADEGNRAKRKREEGAKEPRAKAKRGDNIVENLLEEFVIEIGKLQKIVGETTNTQKKIKELTQKLGRMAEYAQSDKIRGWFKERAKTIAPKETTSVGCQTMTNKGAANDYVDEEKINAVKSYVDFNSVKDMNWPARVFKRAFIAKGSPLKTKQSTDLLLTIEEGGGQEGLTKAFFARFPELKDLEGSLATMVVSSRLLRGEEISARNERYIFRVEFDGGPSEWYEILSRIKEIMVRAERSEIAISPPRADRNGEITRRMLECIFRHEEIKCLVFIMPANEKETGNTGVNRNKRGKDPELKAIMIKEAGKTYNQVLRNLKEKLNPTSRAAQAIKRVRETRDGSMLILVDKNDGRAVEDLKQEICSEGAEGISIKEGRSKETTLYIRDIDGLVEKEEVIRAVNKEIGGNQESYRTSELRPYFGGNQAITLWMEEKKAKILKEKQTIRIGLSLCSISEKLEVKRCYKCWQYGHLRAECRDSRDLSEACRRCGNFDHKERECQEQDYCLQCKQGGHRAGTGRCPEFQKALKRARTLKKKKRSY